MMHSRFSGVLSRPWLAAQTLLGTVCLFHQRSVTGVAADSAVRQIEGSVFASGSQVCVQCLAGGRFGAHPLKHEQSCRDNYQTGMLLSRSSHRGGNRAARHMLDFQISKRRWC